MDNRRPTGTSPEKTFSRGGSYRKNGETSSGQRTFQPRDNRYQPRDDRYQSRREDRFATRDDRPPRRDNNNKFQARDGNGSGGRYQPRDDNKFQPRGDRFQPRDDKYQPREGDNGRKFQPRDNRFQSRDNRFQPRDGGGASRYPRRDERGERGDNRGAHRNDRFAPRKNFVPRGGGKPLPPWKRIEKPRIYDEMQITDGKHIGKFLKSTDSPKVRPTARRVRETMFKIIFRKVRAGRFLDLCAGSGAVGIEAISRGALICSFVERSAKMCAFIKKNLESCGIKEGHGEVFNMEIVPFLKQMSKRRRFWDVVFYDPPYDTDYDEVLAYLSRGVCLKPGGTLVIEHHAEMFFPERLGVLQRWRVVNLGETALSFYERK